MSKAQRKAAFRRELQVREAALAVPRERQIYALTPNRERRGLCDRDFLADATYSVDRGSYSSELYDFSSLTDRYNDLETWDPLHLVPEVDARFSTDTPVSDYCNWGPVMIFSAAAQNALSNHLQPCGRFLDLTSDAGEFVAYRLLQLRDVLDLDNCIARWLPAVDGGTQTLVSIQVYSFHTNMLDFTGMFRVPQEQRVFVLQEFVDIVESETLTGFAFQRVWPMVLQPHWNDLLRF